MAEAFDDLLELQAHDTALDQLRHRIEALPERAELAAVGARRTAVEGEAGAVSAQIEELAGRQAQLEQQTAATAARRHEIDDRMRSGQSWAARDLQAMDQEVHHLVERQHDLEELELTLLEEEEPLDALLAAHRAELDDLAVAAERLEAEIATAEAGLRESIAEKERLRDKLAALLPPALYERYDRLRTRLDGIGVARLEGGRCGGCHLTLPSVEVEQIRQLPSGELATCTQCDRLLVP